MQLGHPPKRIDLLTTIDGVRFEDCWPDCLEVDLAGTTAALIDVANLIRDERASGRLQDSAGAEARERSR